MKLNNIKIFVIAVTVSLTAYNCNNDDDNNDNILDFSGTYSQEDQMGRPAINTVFTSTGSKDAFNVTVPSNQAVAFQAMYEANLIALSPAFTNDGDNDPSNDDKNALGQNAEAFTTLLATDVLNVATSGQTTFFNPSPLTVLTGRALTDDVIDVELLLIFGGEDFTENPGLTSDGVGSNDKDPLPSFPYLATPW